MLSINDSYAKKLKERFSNNNIWQRNKRT